MNSENIKKLIELFGTLGASSKEAFIWFLVLDFAKFLIGILLALTIACLIYRLINRALVEGKCERALREVAIYGGAKCYSLPLSNYEVTEIVNHFRKK